MCFAAGARRAVKCHRKEAVEGPGTSPAQCEPRPTPGPVGHPRWLPACPLEGRAAPEDKVCRRVPPGPGPTNEGARGRPEGTGARPVPRPGGRSSRLCTQSVHTMAAPPILQTRVWGRGLRVLGNGPKPQCWGQNLKPGLSDPAPPGPCLLPLDGSTYESRRRLRSRGRGCLLEPLFLPGGPQLLATAE